MSLKLLFSILALIPSLVFGQEQPRVKKPPRPFLGGYILYDDDRKREVGYVQEFENKRRLDKINFRRSTTGVIREIRAVEEHLVGFGFHNGAEYHAIGFTHEAGSGKFFVKVLVEGDLSLYSDNDTLILKLQTGTTVELNSSNFRSALKDATASCPAVNKLAEYLRFNPEVLADYIKGYNTCLTKDPGTFDPFEKKKRIYLGFSSGIEFTTLDASSLGFYPSYSLGNDNHFFAGLLLYVPFTTSQVLELGAIYKSYNFQGTGIVLVNNYGYLASTLTLSSNEIMLPATFRQSLWTKGKTTIQGSVGVAFPVLLSQSGQIATRDSYSMFTKPIMLDKRMQYNFGIGANIIIKERHRLLIQNIFFFGTGSLSTYLGSIETSLNGYSLFVGYTLW